MAQPTKVEPTDIEKRARANQKLQAWKTCADALKDLPDEDKTSIVVSLKELFGIYIPN